MLEGLPALVVATAILVALPGPNAALIVANSLRLGLSAGIATVFGTTAGVAAQLLLVALGLATVVEFAAGALAAIKWLGVLYLIYLGIRTWREPVPDLSRVTAQRTMFLRGAAVAAINPKTLLFNAAFLPQFVSPNAMPADMLVIAGVYLSVLLAGDCLWAVFASAARPVLGRFASLRRRLTGSLLIAAGVGLALARKAND